MKMGKQPKRLIVCLLALFLSCRLLFPLPSALGFGDFDSSWDFGSDYDSSWDSGYDSDYDSGGWGYDSRDHGYDSWDSGYDSRSWGDTGGPVQDYEVYFMLVLLTAAALYWGLRLLAARPGRGGKASSRSARRTQVPLQPMETFVQRHPDADLAGLEAFVGSLYRDMQTGWEKGNIDLVRDRFTQDTWHRFNSQLAAKTARGETAHVRDIRLKDIRLLGWRAAPREDQAILSFAADNLVWTTGPTGKVLSGSPSRRLQQGFQWTLVWYENGGNASLSCPNCGNTVDASSFAVCPFCGTELSGPGGGWKLTQIEAIYQTTVHS